jgi:ATP sulfurylase
MDIAIYPISGKPYHKGHHNVVLKALNENDVVILIVSLKDRDNISGASMAKIWKDLILPKMPENVKTVFLMSSPIKHVFEILQKAESEMQHNTFRIYSDENDIQTYKNIESHYPFLCSKNYINLRTCNRQDIADISGTKMREYLKNGDRESFIKWLPNIIDGEEVFNILSCKNIV